MRILLLADDNITVQRVIALTFADEQIQVVTCVDGKAAIERIAAERPDIVLAATSLPTVNGYDLARFVRDQPELKDVPVLLLSGAFENVDEARVVSSGASGIIEKPVEPNNVIGRVKELLGLKSEPKPATTGRLVTPAAGARDKKPPVAAPPRVAAPARAMPPVPEPPREQTAVVPAPQPSEGPAAKPDDYLGTLDAAFDTLDQQLSGGEANAQPARNPSGPLGQSSGAPDPRSPGREPKSAPSTSAPGNPVFEVDDDWFGGEDAALADARAGRREARDDLREPAVQLPGAEPAPNDVFEVDDEWFAEDNKARAAKLEESRTLASEMGIHEVELPAAAPSPNAVAPASGHDFDFGLDDIKRLQASAPAAAVEEVPHGAVAAPQLIAEMSPPMLETAAPIVPALEELVADPRQSSTAAPEQPVAPSASGFADDFAQLLAFEQGEHHEPPMAPTPEVRYVVPEITGDMLENIAARVADRLAEGPFGERLRDAMMATIRDVTKLVAYETSERVIREVATATSDRVVRDVAFETSERVAREISTEASARVVREVVVETSERLVRDEIERIKSKHQ